MNQSLHWHVLGGNNKNRIGMNSGLCVYEEENSLGEKTKKIILFDAGTLNGDAKAPEDPQLTDFDTVIPDLTRYFLKINDPHHQPDSAVDSIFLTHSHSDHIGALPFLLLMGYQLPKIYATPYTAKRLEQEFSNANIPPHEWPKIITMAPGQPVYEGPVKISSFWVSHSTPQSVGYFIETPEGNILTPGDFKLDQTVVWGPAFNEDQFKRVVSKPVDLMVLDSTGADSDVAPITEEDVRETLRELMEQYPDKRFVVAVMSGFEENLASVAKVVSEYSKTLWVAGWSHEQALYALKETGLSLSDSIGHDVDVRILAAGKAARDLAGAKPESAVVVVTGAQGKNNAALTRAADGHHNALNLDPEKDIILFCAPSIPGQEGTRASLLATLRNKGFKVLTRADAPLYSQAHARLSELVDFAKLVEAKTILPAHGDENLRGKCAEVMEKIGQKVQQANNGAVIKVSKNEGCEKLDATENKNPMIGFGTIQGQSWFDKNYVMKQIIPVENQPDTEVPSKKPKIFNIGPK